MNLEKLERFLKVAKEMRKNFLGGKCTLCHGNGHFETGLRLDNLTSISLCWECFYNYCGALASRTGLGYICQICEKSFAPDDYTTYVQPYYRFHPQCLGDIKNELGMASLITFVELSEE